VRAWRVTIGQGGNLEGVLARRGGARSPAARQAGASVIALAHTEDDQVETVLLRLLRGAGRRGLGGMHVRRGRLWRPLLAVTRADVRRHLGEQGLPYRIDRTNADLRHARNRLRRLVVPLLAREFNPRLGPAIAALADRLRDEDAFLDQLARERATPHRRGGSLATSVASEPPALARRIVRAWLAEAGGRGVTAREVERTLALARGARGNVAVRGPARIVREGDRLVRRPGRSAVPPRFHHQVRGACAIDGPDGAWRLSVSAPRDRASDEALGLSAAVRFDADRLALPSTSACRRAIESGCPGSAPEAPGPPWSEPNEGAPWCHGGRRLGRRRLGARHRPRGAARLTAGRPTSSR
jgi:tRNA(Ile)-lysidine synthase